MIEDLKAIIDWLRTERPRSFYIEDAALALRQQVSDRYERYNRASAAVDVLADLGFVALAEQGRGRHRHRSRYHVLRAEVRV